MENINFVNNYNIFTNLSSQATYTMQKFVKEEDFNKQEMNQKQTSSNSFAPTTRSVRPFSLQYLDDENNPCLPIKIQNENSDAIQRDADLNSSSQHSVVHPASKKSSVYHNFQKHLITTLKLHINFSNYRRSHSNVDRLMVELWQYFLKSNRPTKRYLYSLLMNIPENIIEFKNKYRDKTHQEEFQRIITEASHQDLCKAQKSLRFYLMKQCKKLVENGQLNHRRMHKIDEFKDYFSTFINDLEKGELNLRLPKPNRVSRKVTKRQKKINRDSPQEQNNQ